MQFTLLTAAFLSCMTLLVSAAPISSPAMSLEAREVLPREVIPPVEVARSAEPDPICTKGQCS